MAELCGSAIKMTPTITNNAPNPPGPAEKRKLYAAIGVIAVAVLALVAFSGSQVQTAVRPKVDSAVQPTTPETSGQLADEVQKRADDLKKKNADLKRVLNEQRKKQGLPPLPEEPHSDSALPLPAPNTQPYTAAQPIPAEVLKRNDTLHASNIAWSARGDSASPTPTDSAKADPDALLRDLQQQTAKLKDQIAANIAQAEQMQIPAQPPAPRYQYTERRPEPQSPEPPNELTAASGPMYRVFEGTTLDGILLNRIDGTYSGPVNAIITTPVYSHDDQHVLIPIGSKVLGDAKQVTSTGDRRLAVSFHRLLMPDAFSVNLDAMPGMDQAGAMGLTGKVNSHYLSIFGASLAIGAIGGLAQIGNGYSGFGYDPSVQFRNGISESMGQSSSRVLDRFLNKLPTVTIREGTRVKVYFTGDLQLPDYSSHKVRGDI